MSTSDTLTASQKRAETQLEFFMELQTKGIRVVNGIASRPFPMVIAPSGTGKTYLVNRMATRHKLPMFSINVPNWIPRGAKADTQITIEQLKSFVANNAAGVILLDEVNKMTVGHTTDSAWSSDIFSECLAVLDQDVRLETMGMEGLVQKFRRHFLVVGAAAFQDEWLRSASASNAIGFVEGEQTQAREAVFERLVRTQHLVPEELLNRFNDRLIVIAPPTAPEFADRIRGIRSFLSLRPLKEPELTRLGQEAAASGKMMRWLEGYLSQCLAEVPEKSLARLATAAEEGSAPSSGIGTSPFGTSSNQNTVKWRDMAFDAYAAALQDLARSATRVCALCDSVIMSVSLPYSTPLQEKLFEGMKLGGHNLGESKSSLEQIQIYGKGLRYIAYHAARLALPSVPPDVRAENAGKVQRFSYRMGKALQAMTSLCDDYNEARLFFEAATEFVFCSENASARLDHLRTFDTANNGGKPI
ncbi:MAG TPA: AAA family ATPase [Terrimicrobiaceae bacterium]|nr:AAA family ATPase [Terrimicrobiaceae bacterium]